LWAAAEELPAEVPKLPGRDLSLVLTCNQVTGKVAAKFHALPLDSFPKGIQASPTILDTPPG
jgi:hypothetical protein